MMMTTLVVIDEYDSSDNSNDSDDSTDANKGNNGVSQYDLLQPWPKSDLSSMASL